jgi:probable HAF family extracellular repeat protein
MAVFGLVALAACADRPTGPDASILAAKGGGGGGPNVEAADPPSATQGTTLDVRVIGSGFDEGSAVKLLLGGQSTAKVVTHSTQFVDRNTLIANITIDDIAEIALYDIEVTTGRGKKGIGTELFAVKEKGKPGDEEPQFTITTTDLGTLEGSSSAIANHVASGPDGLNVRVVGKSGNGAFYWTPGGPMVELAVLFGPNASLKVAEAIEVNDAGQIAGQRWEDRGDIALSGLQATFWNSSTAQNIDLPAEARSNFATAINNNGQVQVVGQSYDHPDDPDAPHQHAMLWTVDAFGTVTTQDLLADFVQAGGFISSQAEGVNDRGQIVGWANNGSAERAFLWDNGAVTFLDGEVDAGFLSFAYAINNAVPVQIIGGAHDPSGEVRRVLLWTVSNGTVSTEELVPLAGFDWAWATDLNDAGEVTGQSAPASQGQEPHATLWTFDPNTGGRAIVDLGVGSATAIDNSASLVGLTRVVGSATVEVGKGRKKTRNNHAVMWEVEPIP